MFIARLHNRLIGYILYTIGNNMYGHGAHFGFLGKDITETETEISIKSTLGRSLILIKTIVLQCCDAAHPTPIYWNLLFDFGGIIGFLLIGPVSSFLSYSADWFFLGSTLFFGLLNCCLIATCSRAQNGVFLANLPMNEPTSQRVQCKHQFKNIFFFVI